MLAHAPPHALATGYRISDVAAIGYVIATTHLVGAKIIGSNDASIFHGDESLAAWPHPIGQRLRFAHLAGKRIGARITGPMMDQMAPLSFSVARLISMKHASVGGGCPPNFTEGHKLRRLRQASANSRAERCASLKGESGAFDDVRDRRCSGFLGEHLRRS